MTVSQEGIDAKIAAINAYETQKRRLFRQGGATLHLGHQSLRAVLLEGFLALDEVAAAEVPFHTARV